MERGSTSMAQFRRYVFLTVLLVLGVALAWTYLAPSEEGTSYAYSAMLANAQAGRVLSISQQGAQLAVHLAGVSDPRTVFVASEAVNVYSEVCAATGKQPGPDCAIEYKVTEPSVSAQWVGLLVTALLPVLLIGGFIYFMTRSQQKKQG